jgi:hypothetical protein
MALRWILTVLVTCVLLNSVFRFFRRREEARQALASILSALLILLFAIYYNSWLSWLFTSSTSPESSSPSAGTTGPSTSVTTTSIAGSPTTVAPTVQPHPLASVHLSGFGQWIHNTATTVISDSWIHVGPHPNVEFVATVVPVTILIWSYAIRGGIYRYCDNDTFRRIHDLASAYAASLTFALIGVVVVGTIYDVSPGYQLLMVVVALFLFLTPSLRLIAKLLAMILKRVGHEFATVGRTVAKVVVLGAVAVSQFVKTLDDSVRRFLEIHIEKPLTRIFERIDTSLEKGEEGVHKRLKRREGRERDSVPPS